MNALLQKHLPLIEFSLRLYVAYYMFDYGLAKLTGDMFNNATPAILNKPLQQVDLMHLTWYFFHRCKLLTVVVGVSQIAASLCLLYRRTVLLGCVIGLVIFLNIFLIDATVFSDHVLAVRVLLYMVSLCLIVAYRKQAFLSVIRIMFANNYKTVVSNKLYWLFVPVLLALFLLLEILVCSLFR